jgi:hypothetical protein
MSELAKKSEQKQGKETSQIMASDIHRHQPPHLSFLSSSPSPPPRRLARPTPAASMACPCAFLLLLLLAMAATAASDVTTFKLYFHDMVGGPRPTAIRITQAASSNSSSNSFGAVVAIGDPLTTGRGHRHVRGNRPRAGHLHVRGPADVRPAHADELRVHGGGPL